MNKNIGLIKSLGERRSRRLWDYVYQWQYWVMNKVFYRSEYDGIRLYFAKDQERFFKAVQEALALVKNSDPRRYVRIKDHLKSIICMPRANSKYSHMQRACYLADKEWNTIDLAAAIIHEATHGLLISKGFIYEDDPERHERICTEEEVRFSCRAAYSGKRLTTEESDRIKEEENRKIKEALKTQWWDPRLQRERRLNFLRCYLKWSFTLQEHYLNGRLRQEARIVKGKKNGAWRMYYDNGDLQAEGSFKNDQKQGLFRIYAEHKTLMRESTYVCDKLHGPYKEYYPNGRLKLDVDFKDDKKDGTVKWHYESGVVSCEGVYTDGKMNGRFKWYDEQGNLQTQEYYKDDQRIEEERPSNKDA